MAPTTLDPSTPLSGPALHWPAGVRAVVEPRRHAMLADCSGAVLDLATGLPGTPGDTAGPFDTVCSVGALTAFADLPAALARVHDVLSPDGFFRFIEPVGHPGWKGMLGATAGAHLPALRGVHVGRNVPAAVRSAGFLICRLERFTVPTSVWPLRDFVQAEARLYEAPSESTEPTAPSEPSDETTGEKTEGESE